MGYRLDVLLKPTWKGSGIVLENGIINNVTEISASLGPSDEYLEDYDYIVNNFWSGVELPHSVKLVDNSVLNTNYHEIENYMYAAHQLGYKGGVPEQWVGNWKWQGSINGTRIGIHSGCFGGGWEKKKWEKFSRLVGELLIKDFRVINFGIEDEKIRPDGMMSTAGPMRNYFDYAGQLTIAETITHMTHCDYFIANDSGLMHIADALGIPTIAIFGPTLVVKNRPVGKNSMTIQASKDCVPCQYTPNFSKCESNECLKSISPEFVYGEFVKLRKELRNG